MMKKISYLHRIFLFFKRRLWDGWKSLLKIFFVTKFSSSLVLIFFGFSFHFSLTLSLALRVNVLVQCVKREGMLTSKKAKESLLEGKNSFNMFTLLSMI